MKRLITFLCIQVSITLGTLGAVTETFDDESVFPAFGLGGITATQHTGAFGEWTLYDGNGMKVYGLTDIEYENKYEPSAWMVFNRAKTNPVHGDGKSHSGHQCMMSIVPVENHVPATTDHWLISPELSGEAQTITFYARQLTTQYGNEKYEVLASSTNNDPTSFLIVGSTREITGEDWQEVSVTLPAGAKYFAIRHISYDIFGLMVDDITYEPKGSSGGDDDPSGGSFFYYQNEDGTLTITHAGERWHGPQCNQHYGTCCSYAGDIVIPEEIDGKTVSAVGKAAFWRSDITSLKLPNTLKLIAEEAFLECHYVKELTIPASVDSIGPCAFNQWDALESVTIEDSPNVLHTGSGGSFVNSSIFSDQPLLKKAYVGRNHKSPLYGSMGWEVNLFGRSNLEEITYGDYVTEIQMHELIDCNSLKKVNLGKNIKTIGNLAFESCELLSDIAIPDGVEEIGELAFSDCQAMPTQKLPSALRTISEGAFRRCYALTSVTIPASVQTIGVNAFIECDGITAFTLEDSPNTIQLPNRMFDYLRNLTTFYIGRNYTAEYDWYGNAFSNHPTLAEATVGGYATEIPNQMFNGCKVLKKVTWGDNITRIGIDAFHGCDILDDINLPETLVTIDTRAFRRCYALNISQLPYGLKAIGEEAFAECPIETIYIPATVETITSAAFNSCLKMRDIYCYGMVPPVCSGWLFGGVSLSNMTLHYPQGTRDAYKAAECWKEFFDDHAIEFDASGINAITIDGAQNGKVYNLKGQQVYDQATSKGMYILNGKKVIIKK